MAKSIIEPSAQSCPTGWDRTLDVLIKIIALVMVAYHAYTTWRPLFNDLVHQNIHLGFALTVLILFWMKGTTSLRQRILCLVGVVLAVGCTAYMHFNFERLDMWSGYPELRDYPVGILLPLLVLVVGWIQWGLIFTSLAIIAVCYALFGHLLPGALGHAHMEPAYVMSMMGVGYRGVYGTLLNASAIIIMPFIIFGSAFESVGINKVFIEIGNFIGNRLRGGTAQVAVFSSTFVSMCTGAAMANVALTGSYTIPLMKENGYKPEQAAAIEALASTGGQITPPVMGVAVFIMANFLGISYNILMIKAIIPAVLFLILAATGAILIAQRERLSKITVPVNTPIIYKGIWTFIIPMFAVVFLLLKRYSPAFAAYSSLGLLIGVAFLQKETRPTWGGFIDGLAKGVRITAAIAIVCAVVGIFIRMIVLTGAGIKLAGLIEVISGGNLLIALFLTMLLSIVMGCALPTVPAYAIVALVVAPALVNMGVQQMLAHFFVFYYAVLAVITPPVAPGSIVASKMADADFLKTSWESTKLGAPFFLVPYFIIHNPLLVLEPQKGLFGIVLAILGIIIACGSLMTALQRRYITDVSGLERIFLFITTLFATIFGVTGSYPCFGLAAITTTIVTISQIKKCKTLSGLHPQTQQA